jgi:hypothetical protein
MESNSSTEAARFSRQERQLAITRLAGRDLASSADAFADHLVGR